ncbi:MAG: HupE/UreJ family protein [Pseudolabrys sp.]|nr:HupE/UreJ family protein [Pseudolabrys sp.]
MIRLVALLLAVLAPNAAFAHVGHGATTSFEAGFAHPLGGLDHVAVMVAVGLWAALKGGRALWLWPAAFVAVMLVGGTLGMAQIALPLVEPAILASIVAIGLLVALAIDAPLRLGAAVVGVFALFHGHAHGTEITESISGLEYTAGFTTATALLHVIGLAFALSLTRAGLRLFIRAGGMACVAIGLTLTAGTFG